MKETRVDIIPGGMLSDVVPNKMGSTQHLFVKNLRQNKLGQWEPVNAYKELATGLSNVKAAIEVTEDRTDERFILFQSGTSLYRLDYASGYGGIPVILILPAGVTISSSVTLRFFYHNGVVRITGASKPLWYGYIDEKLFLGNVLGNEVDVDEWHLTATEIKNNLAVEVTDTRFHSNSEGASGTRYWFSKVFYVYDDSQYSYMADFDSIAAPLVGTIGHTGLSSEIGATNAETEFVAFDITVAGVDLKDNFNDKRITGIGIAIAISTEIQTDENRLDWRVGLIVPVNTLIEDKRWSQPNFSYDGTNNDKLTIPSGENLLFDGFMAVGDQIIMTNTNGSVTTTISAIGFSGSDLVVTFNDNITDLVGTIGVAEDPIPATANALNKSWDYSSVNGYTIRVAAQGGVGNTFSDFTGIPPGSIPRYPDYRHHVVINGIAYIDSQATGEEDFIAYSPLNQFDSFPAENIFGTEVGDTDRVRAIA